MHLPSQDALLVGGDCGVLCQLEEGVAHLASWGRRPGLLGCGCIFLVPGHQTIDGAGTTPQDPPEEVSFKASPSLPVTPLPSQLLALAGETWTPAPSLTLAQCLPLAPATQRGALPRTLQLAGGWVEGGGGGLTYTAHSSFSLRIDQYRAWKRSTQVGGEPQALGLMGPGRGRPGVPQLVAASTPRSCPSSLGSNPCTHVPVYGASAMVPAMGWELESQGGSK